MKSLQEASLHFLATSNIPTTFYRDEIGTDMKTPAIQHVFVDAGEAGAVDGSGRKCMIIKYGLPGTNSGSIFIESKKVKKSNSTPMDEMEALASAVGKIYAARTLSEELAGLRLNPFVTDDLVLGSPNPTVILTNQRAVESINSKDTGDTNCLVRTQAIKRLQGPSIVFGDNDMVVKIANADGRVNIKGLRPVLREIGSIHRAKQEGIVDYIQIASKDNLSNPLSKFPSSPLAHILGLEGIVGKSPQMEVLKQQAEYGKEPNKKQLF